MRYSTANPWSTQNWLVPPVSIEVFWSKAKIAGVIGPEKSGLTSWSCDRNKDDTVKSLNRTVRKKNIQNAESHKKAFMRKELFYRGLRLKVLNARAW